RQRPAGRAHVSHSGDLSPVAVSGDGRDQRCAPTTPTRSDRCPTDPASGNEYMNPRTLFEKIWDAHVVADEGDGWFLLHVDRHVVLDMNGDAFGTLAKRNIGVRNPELT